MKPIRLAGAVAAAAALAMPAAAAAHPSVYTSNARINNPPVAQKRYVVANHGFTYVLTESNGKDNDFGVMDYKFMPGAYRATLPTTAALLDEGDTGAQAHATCFDDDGAVDSDGVEALWTTAAISNWQDTAAPIEPFYNYVPFQKAAVGIDDHPADWIDDVKTLTGVDLATVSDDPATAATQLETMCETTLEGTFVPPDTTQSTIAAFNSGTIEHTEAPLEAKIGQLEADKAAALQAASTADAAAKAATARAIAAENALAAEKTPLAVKLADNRQAARQVANRGATVQLTGPPAREVTLRLLIDSARAKALGLKTNVLGRETVTTAADGTAGVTVEVSKKAADALKKLKTSLKLNVSAVAGDRVDNASGTLTR